MMSRVVVASLVGATIEWYDFFLYGVVAGIVLNKQFFPSSDPTVGTLLAYATFAVGFITRPIGGIIFGHFGDKIGRKSMPLRRIIGSLRHRPLRQGHKADPAGPKRRQRVADPVAQGGQSGRMLHANPKCHGWGYQ